MFYNGTRRENSNQNCGQRLHLNGPVFLSKGWGPPQPSVISVDSRLISSSNSLVLKLRIVHKSLCTAEDGFNIAGRRCPPDPSGKQIRTARIRVLPYDRGTADGNAFGESVSAAWPF